jgi:hypothetical protein
LVIVLPQIPLILRDGALFGRHRLGLAERRIASRSLCLKLPGKLAAPDLFQRLAELAGYVGHHQLHGAHIATVQGRRAVKI